MLWAEKLSIIFMAENEVSAHHLPIDNGIKSATVNGVRLVAIVYPLIALLCKGVVTSSVFFSFSRSSVAFCGILFKCNVFNGVVNWLSISFLHIYLFSGNNKNTLSLFIQTNVAFVRTQHSFFAGQSTMNGIFCKCGLYWERRRFLSVAYIKHKKE